MAIEAIALATRLVTPAADDAATRTPTATAAQLPGKPVPGSRVSETRQKVDIEDLRAQIEEMNRTLQERRSNLAFSVDEGTGKTVVRVVQQSTGEIIRQIPSEEALAIAHSLRNGATTFSLGLDAQS